VILYRRDNGQLGQLLYGNTLQLSHGTAFQSAWDYCKSIRAFGFLHGTRHEWLGIVVRAYDFSFDFQRISPVTIRQWLEISKDAN
jgi:hypothetical protein